jgi:hypothetical protein
MPQLPLAPAGTYIQVVYPDYGCLSQLTPTDSGTLGNEAYNCDMSNPARNYMRGVTCHLAQVDGDAAFADWTSSLSTSNISSGAERLIDNANSRLVFFCSGPAPTASPVRPPIPSFPAAPLPTAGWSQVFVYPNYACLSLGINMDPATLSADAQACDQANPGRSVLANKTCFLEQTDVDDGFDIWYSTLALTAASDVEQQAIDSAASRMTYFCAQ